MIAGHDVIRMIFAIRLEMAEVERAARERECYRGARREPDHARPRRIDMAPEPIIGRYRVERLADMGGPRAGRCIHETEP